MDLDFLFFRLPAALRFIFKINYIPQEADFKELTSEQYATFYNHASDKDLSDVHDQKILAFLPEDPRVYNRLIKSFGDDMVIVSESELVSFAEASEFIDNSCNKSGKIFNTISEKLAYIAQLLPAPFSEGTPYAFHKKATRTD